MTRPLLPPDFVKVPVELLFDTKLSPTLKVTLMQLRAMAWGKTETPPFSAAEFEELTGTDVKTFYKHLGALHTHDALRWRRGISSTFIVSFECSDVQAVQTTEPAEILKNEKSQNGELPLSLAPDQKLTQSDQKLVASQNREFSKSRKPAANGELRRELFETLADLTGRTPVGRDWSLMPDVVRGILNKAVSQLAKADATKAKMLGFPDWYKDLGKRDYRYRRTLEPWDVVKLWPSYTCTDTVAASATYGGFDLNDPAQAEAYYQQLNGSH